jgi:type IX secretion system PorP/SprF family membrane protein
LGTLNSWIDRMRVRTIIVGLILILVPMVGQAQLYPVFSQYYFNELVINPAYAGAHVQLSANTTYRNQWINFPGSPRTFSFSAHTAFVGGRVGTGLLVNIDKIGSYSNKDITASYAYKIRFGESTLSFGVQGMLYFVGADFSRLLLMQIDDPGFVPINEFKPNVGAGIFYSKKNFFAGFSVPYLINSSFSSVTADQVATELRQARYYFLRTGAVFKLDPKGDIKINPNFLIRAQEGQPLSADINTGVIFYDVFSAGVSVRLGDSFISFVSLKLSEKLFFSYSFDFTHSTLNPFSSGSHEIQLNFRQRITSIHKELNCPTYYHYRE